MLLRLTLNSRLPYNDCVEPKLRMAVIAGAGWGFEDRLPAIIKEYRVP